jgi:hypothetical protein
MDTDQVGDTRRRHLALDLERRFGHLRVAGVPAGGDVTSRPRNAEISK